MAKKDEFKKLLYPVEKILFAWEIDFRPGICHVDEKAEKKAKKLSKFEWVSDPTTSGIWARCPIHYSKQTSLW